MNEHIISYLIYRTLTNSLEDLEGVENDIYYYSNLEEEKMVCFDG